MEGRLFVTVRPLPDVQELDRLRAALDAAFPRPENAAYLDALSAVGRAHVPARVAAARLGALLLLPSLSAMAGGNCAELRLLRDGHGRPFVLDGMGRRPFDFNLSHSSAHVAAALLVGDGRVGIDAEEPLPPARAEALIRRYATDGERRLLGHADMDFARLWTVREAMAKYDGRGAPLRYDAATPLEGVCLHTARLTDTGAVLTVCHARGAVGDLCPAEDSLPIHLTDWIP